MTRFLRSFAHDTRATVGVMFAPISGMLLLTVGATIDYTAMVTARSEAQSLVDAAALAGSVHVGTTASEGSIKSMMVDHFNTNTPTDRFDVRQLTTQIDRTNDSVTVQAVVRIKMAFMGMVGKMHMDVPVTATAIGGNREVVVDIAMCIDATGSMFNTLAAVKQNAVAFDENLKQAIADRGRQVDQINVRPVYFRDFDSEGPDVPWLAYYERFYPGFYDRRGIRAMTRGPFYKLPDERLQFTSFVSNQRATGGGDRSEAGLECFYEAMISEWSVPQNNSQLVYPLIAIWTDAPADSPGNTLNIQYGGDQYPVGMPTTYSDLKAAWEDSANIAQDTKTAILFGPRYTNGWRTVTTWDKFDYGGSVTDGNRDLVGRIADAIYRKLPPPQLTH